MNDLLMLIAMVIASIGAASLILAFSEFVIITLPRTLVLSTSRNNASLGSSRQRSSCQSKTGACPFNESG